MRIALDSNVLLYAEGLNDPDRQAVAKRVLAGLDGSDLVIAVQVLAELISTLRRKFRRSAASAIVALRGWQELSSDNPETTQAVFDAALEIVSLHGFQIFDAIILAAAAEAGCRMLLSEDMQDGFVWRGVTVVNPFAAMPHPLLADLLRR